MPVEKLRRSRATLLLVFGLMANLVTIATFAAVLPVVDWNDNELRMMKYLNERCIEIARALNGLRLGGKNKGTHFGITGYQSTHNVGGAVMGSDPSTSVVNKYLQSWDVSNLFVVGGSAFPQNPANGPTETIGMLACWAADAIKESYVRSPGPLV